MLSFSKHREITRIGCAKAAAEEDSNSEQTDEGREDNHPKTLEQQWLTPEPLLDHANNEHDAEGEQTEKRGCVREKEDTEKATQIQREQHCHIKIRHQSMHSSSPLCREKILHRLQKQAGLIHESHVPAFWQHNES